ncbi:MAG: DUF1294 domain-containing protein [Patescibacteria group bacterium]
MKRKTHDDIFYFIIWVCIIAGGWFSFRWVPFYLDTKIQLLIAVNVATFILYGLDKLFATSRMWRVSERLLFFTALLFGSPGAIIGMNLFHHKTSKTSFQLVFVLIVFIQAVLIAWYFELLPVL